MRKGQGPEVRGQGLRGGFQIRAWGVGGIKGKGSGEQCSQARRKTGLKGNVREGSDVKDKRWQLGHRAGVRGQGLSQVAEVCKLDNNHRMSTTELKGQGPGAPCSDTAHLSCCSWGQSPCEHRSCKGHTLGSPTSPVGTAGPSWGGEPGEMPLPYLSDPP